MGERPYNDPANKLSSGQPRMGEDAWSIAEQHREIAVHLEGRVAKVEALASSLMALVAKLSDTVSKKEMITLGNIVSNRLDSHRDAIKALAVKLDAEDVTNLDTDYAASVTENLG